MPEGKRKRKKKITDDETGGVGGNPPALTLGARAWDFSKSAVKAALVWSLALFAVAGVTAITVFFVLQGGAAWGVSAEITDLVACISGLIMFVVYAASWGRAILETYGYLPSVPSKPTPPEIQKEVDRYAVWSYLLSFTAAALIALGAYLGFVTFAAAFGLPILMFQILGVLSGLGMMIVLGDFLDYTQRRKNYKDYLIHRSEKGPTKEGNTSKIRLFTGQAFGIFIGVMAAIGFGVFKAFPINDFIASMGLATGELLLDLTLVGALIITISSFFTSTWAIWNVFKAWSRGEKRHSASEYPPPTTLFWKIVGGAFVLLANVLNSMGPVISIFIFVTAFTPAAPVAIFLWVMAGIFFIARAVDFHITSGEYTLNTFRKVEEWFGMGKSASSDEYMNLELVASKKKGVFDAQENTATRAKHETQNGKKPESAIEASGTRTPDSPSDNVTSDNPSTTAHA